MSFLPWHRSSPTPEPLRLPRGVRFPSIERDSADAPDELRRLLVEAERETKHVQLTTGYVAHASISPAYAAFIEANVHADALWTVVCDLVNVLLPIVASPVIGIKEEKLTLGPYTHRERALAVLEPFIEELSHDGFLQWGVMYQYHGVTEEVFVTTAKYVQIWTNDPRRAAKVLHRHGIPEVEGLKFVDNYPVVSQTLLREGGCAGWSYVLERVTQEFTKLPRVYAP